MYRKQTHTACSIDDYVCQNEKKICLALRAAVFMRMLLLCRTSYAIKTADVLRAPFYVRKRILYSFFLRCDAATQQGRDLSDLHRACFGNDVAHFFLFRLIAPAKIKNGQQSRTYVFISNFPVWDAYCTFCPFHLAWRQYIVHCNQRSFLWLWIIRYLMIVQIKYFYSCLWICWRSAKTLCKVLFFFF